MELRTLRYFITVAERLNFSAAAEALELSQSAVSRQIQLLEEELGILLFDRVGRKVFLTPAGRELLERSYEVRKDVESLTSRAAELASGDHGTIRIGATPQTLESLVSLVLPRFQQKHPQVRVALFEDGSANLVRAVEQGSVDVAIGAPGPHFELESRPLFPLFVLAAFPAGHRLANRKTLDITDLAKEPVLLLRKDFMTRLLFDGACQLAHIAPAIMLESASPHCLLTLAQRGLGTAIIPSTVRLAKGHPPVVPLMQSGRQLGLWMHAMWDGRRYTPPALSGFINEVALYVATGYPGKSFRLGGHMRKPTAGKTLPPRDVSKG